MLYELIILIFGWLYPAFASYNGNNSQRAQVTWLKFWIVFGVFNAVHFFTSCLEPYVPFLGSFKLCLLFWLLPTMGGGCLLVYDELIDPLMQRNKHTIRSAFDGMTNVSSALLRELVKMIYHLLVDIVEQCWQLTRNADDIHVTPRLQSAINEVIAELRIARTQAATEVTGGSSQLQLQLLDESSECLSEEGGADTQEEQKKEQTQLLIQLGEANSARRMQLSLELASREHLAPINSPLRKLPPPQPKPKRGKRKLDTPLQMAQMEEVDRVYHEVRKYE